MSAILALISCYVLIMIFLAVPFACANLRVSCARCAWEQTQQQRGR